VCRKTPALRMSARVHTEDAGLRIVMATQPGVVAGGDQTLQLADEVMFRRQLTRMQGERTVPMTVGIFMSEGQPLPSLTLGTTAEPKVSRKRTRR
jgi:hypothetical protein